MIKRTIVGMTIVVPLAICAVVGAHTIGRMTLTDAHHAYYPPALNMVLATGVGVFAICVAWLLLGCIYELSKYVGGKVLGERKPNNLPALNRRSRKRKT